MNTISYSTRLHIWLQRLVRWEFWSWRIVYLPVAVYWFFLAIKARGWVFFSAANPCMRFGGLVGYSKSEVDKLIPEDYRPKTIFKETTDSLSDVFYELARTGLSYPLIVKPDQGERGRGVAIIETESDLESVLSKTNERMLVQEYANLPMELGVMYSRHPKEAAGRITSIVVKDFPRVIGDGESTLMELILNEHRARLSYEVHVKKFGKRILSIPKKGEEIQIVTIGNHMRGTTFFNGNHLISTELETVFDNLAKQIHGFHIGRFDLKTDSIEELLKGNFVVIELNGVNSEPCHIFHPGRSIFLAWRDLFKHWKRIADVSIANHKKGVEYASYSEIRAEIKRHKAELRQSD
ncbi:ATP-grasp domain-containing protein [Flavobacteriales bacterium]|nr:ATP-grasp domain-containing protein [Flavobacteriales bacterium]